jgi:Protein of unknown function (DUF3176)
MWLWETLAGLLFLASLAATIVTLRLSQNKPLPQMPFKLSINTLLSFETTCFKGALALVMGSIISQAKWSWFSQHRPLYDLVRYDNAANGPWGSLQWLGTHHLRNPVTAFAATIMVLSTVLDPFVQQLVSYVDCQTPMRVLPLNASIPRTNWYYPELPLSIDQLSDTSYLIPAPIQQAIIDGIQGSPINIDYGCFSRNCTFPGSYSTMGYCSECYDVSSKMEYDYCCLFNSSSVDGIYCSPAFSNCSQLLSITSSSYGSVLGATLNITSPTHQGYNNSLPRISGLGRFLKTPVMLMTAGPDIMF